MFTYHSHQGAVASENFMLAISYYFQDGGADYTNVSPLVPARNFHLLKCYGLALQELDFPLTGF